MKTIFKTTAAIFAIMMTACSSDDSNNAVVEEPLSERIEYEYTTERLIPNGNNLIDIPINVNEDKVVINPSKVFIEIMLDHKDAQDLSYGYLMPNDGTEFRTIVSKLGGTNNYNANNVLSFNPEHTQVINPNPSFHFPNGIIPSGNYKEGTSNPGFQVETPLFNSMLNKNINGVWRFFFIDDNLGHEGKVIKIKLIFDEGALEVANN